MEVVNMLLLMAIACLALPVSLQETPQIDMLGHPEFTLIPSPDQEVVKGLTKDVKLGCVHSGTGYEKFKEIISIRIERQETGGSWEHLASMTRDSQAVTVEDDKTSGNGVITQGITGSYIEVTWSTAVADTIGVYKCNIVGYDDDLNFITEMTPVTEIKAKPLSASVVFDMLLQEKQKTNSTLYQLKREMMDMKNETVELLREDIEQGDNETKYELGDTIREFRKEMEQSSNETRQEVNREISDIKTNDNILSDQLDNITDKLNDLIEKSILSEWPEGSFGLLQPKAGCPHDIAFEFGSIASYHINAESSDVIKSESTKSDGSHLQEHTIYRENNTNWVTLSFCFVSLERMRSTKWPSGQYCFAYDHTAACPPGSSYSSIEIDEENTDNQSFKVGAQLGGIGSLEFCCVTSGSYDQPIVLPTKSPFYLYRYRGRCQEISGMSVIEEFIEIDTDYYYEIGSSPPPNPSNPSYTIDNRGRLRFYLCYYS